MNNVISGEILDLLLNNILKKSKPQRPGLVLIGDFEDCEDFYLYGALLELKCRHISDKATELVDIKQQEKVQNLA